MKVVKMVTETGWVGDRKLVSTLARGKWRKEYAEGVEVKPDTGYLFAYSWKDREVAKKEIGIPSDQLWSAKAKVVGATTIRNLMLNPPSWHGFWRAFKPQTRAQVGPQASCIVYLLCSSITLIERLK